MKLNKISWRNVGPWGNKLQTLEFPNEGGLTIVCGKNGYGKSFLVNLPKILYYGKLDKFKKDEIANRLNKHGYVEGEIQLNPQTNITIIRKLSPTDLTVYKYRKDEILNLEEHDIGKAGISNYQDYIDVEVVGLPYHIFSNIISLSVNDFKSFISMTPNDKRIIIDKLFAMELINKMNLLIKNDLRDIKINIDLYDREIMSLQHAVKNANKELEKLKEKVNIDNSERLKFITKTLLELKPKYENGQHKLKEYRDKEQDIKKSYNIFVEQKSKLNANIKEIKKKIELYDQDKCPTCETPFSDQRFNLVREDLQNKQKQKEDELNDLIVNEHKYNEAFLKVQEGISKINEFIIQIKSTYNSFKSELDKLKQNKPEEFKSIQNIISKNTSQIKSKEEERVVNDEKYKYLSILEQLYSDAGVKKKILESYLPTLNKEVEYTLNELHFPYSLRFDNDFEPNLQHLGIEINVDTLSTGEKKKVDLAVLISIIRMLKRKYPSLNIFMLDEVLSSIDGDGIYDIIGLLQKTSKEMMINIFIINHSSLPIEYFDFSITISKNDGFSDMEIEKLG